MRKFIAFILSCVSVFAADTGIQVVTTVRTNESGSISTKDVFTRDGHTNLIRNVSIKDGVVRMRVHRFYHDGFLVGMLTATPNSSSTTSWAGCPYSLDFEYRASSQLSYAIIGTKDGVVLDIFACTNGVLVPVPSSEFSNAADIAADAKKLMSRDQKLSPGEFRREVDQMIQKDDK